MLYPLSDDLKTLKGALIKCQSLERRREGHNISLVVPLNLRRAEANEVEIGRRNEKVEGKDKLKEDLECKLQIVRKKALKEG